MRIAADAFVLAMLDVSVSHAAASRAGAQRAGR